MSDNISQRKTRSRIDKKHLKDRKGVWHLRYVQGGKVFARSLCENVAVAGSLSAARHKRDQLISYVRLHGTLPPKFGDGLKVTGYPLAECLKVWIEKRKPSMHVQYTRAAEHLITSMGAGRDVNTIVQEDVDNHCKRRAQTVRPQTYVLERRILRRAIEYAYINDKVKQPPRFYFERIAYAPPGKTAGKEHSLEDIERFMGQLSDKLRRGLIFAFETGVRLHELMRLECRQVIPINDDPLFVAKLYIRADQTKRAANARWIGLTRRAMEQAQWGISAGRFLLFDVGKAPSQAINATNRRHGYTPGHYITMRDMRHYVGYTAERNTGGTAAGMAMLGHRTTAAHEHYRKQSDRHDLAAARAYHTSREAPEE